MIRGVVSFDDELIRQHKDLGNCEYEYRGIPGIMWTYGARVGLREAILQSGTVRRELAIEVTGIRERQCNLDTRSDRVS